MDYIARFLLCCKGLNLRNTFHRVKDKRLSCAEQRVLAAGDLQLCSRSELSQVSGGLSLEPFPALYISFLPSRTTPPFSALSSTALISVPFRIDDPIMSQHAIFIFIYLKPHRYGKDNGPDGHEDESSHEHQPPAEALDQQVLQQTEISGYQQQQSCTTCGHF